MTSHQSENHVGACESRYGDFIIDRHRIIYAGREKNEGGVGHVSDQYMEKCVLGYFQFCDRILVTKLKGKFIIRTNGKIYIRSSI